MNIHELDIFQLNELKQIIKDCRDVYGNRIREEDINNSNFHRAITTQSQLSNFNGFKIHDENLTKVEKLLNYKLLNEIVYE